MPRKWNLMNVSDLNPETIDLIDAPFPFIIGMDFKTWKEVSQI